MEQAPVLLTKQGRNAPHQCVRGKPGARAEGSRAGGQRVQRSRLRGFGVGGRWPNPQTHEKNCPLPPRAFFSFRPHSPTNPLTHRQVLEVHTPTHANVSHGLLCLQQMQALWVGGSRNRRLGGDVPRGERGAHGRSAATTRSAAQHETTRARAAGCAARPNHHGPPKITQRPRHKGQV